jgi:polyisoprenyl-teichoic acid--peptidoglycan teichoic acid transferase
MTRSRIAPHATARERVAARRRQRRKRSGCMPLWIGLVVLLALGALTLVFVWRRATDTLATIEQNDPRRAQTAQPVDLPASLREPFTVLLLGVDSRPNPEEGARSDTLIVAYVQPQEGWAGMLSIPRDTVVQLRGLGEGKINMAYSYGYANAATLYGEATSAEQGGGAFTAEAVEGFLGIEVDYIAQIDFRGFERVVNTIGGITINVEQPLLDATYPTEDYGVERIFIPAGLQVMDGATALKYARSRHASSDFDRSRRQQQVLNAILAEVRKRGMLEQANLLPALARDLEASVRTTLPIADLGVLQGLAAFAQQLDAERIVRLSINPDDVAVIAENGSDIYWDRTGVAQQVARLLSGPDGKVEIARLQVQNGAGVPGLAGRFTERLRSNGFVVNDPVDALVDLPNTIVIDYSGQAATRERLTQTLGIDPRYIFAEPPANAPPQPAETDILIILGADYDTLALAQN